MHAGQMKFSDVAFYPDVPEDDQATTSTALPAIPSAVSVTVFDSIEPLEAEWRNLEAADINSLHQGYEWCKAWIAAYGRPLQIVVGRQDRDVAFILPLEIVHGRLFTKAVFIGAQHANINTGLMSDRFIASATPALMQSIAESICAQVRGADCIILGNMPILWRERLLPFSMLPHVENQNRAFQLPLRATFPETLGQLNAKRRRKKYSVGHRRLEALGGYEHLVATTDAEKQGLLDLFFTQKAARLAEFGLPNSFACSKTRRFLHTAAMLPQTESRFALRMHALRMTSGEHAGEVPAVAGLSRKGDHVIVQFCSIGSGPTTDASPGELLFHLMIEQYNQPDEAVSLFDFGIGDMPFKRSWCPVETVHVNVTLPITPLGRLAVLKEEMSIRLKTMIKQNPAMYHFLQKIRTRAQIGSDAGERGED